MFTELKPLLDKRSVVLIVTAKQDGQIQCSFIPKATEKDEEQDKPLLTPLTLTGTAEELDSGMAEAITDYTETYKSIAEQVADTKKAMKEEKEREEAKRKAEADAKRNKNKQPEPTKKPTTPAPAAKTATTEANPASDAAPSLFDSSNDANDEEEVFEP